MQVWKRSETVGKCCRAAWREWTHIYLKMWSDCSCKRGKTWKLALVCSRLTFIVYCFLEIRSNRQTSHTQDGVKQMVIRKKNEISCIQGTRKVEFSESTSFPGLPLKKKQQGPTARKWLKKKSTHPGTDEETRSFRK